MKKLTAILLLIILASACDFVLTDNQNPKAKIKTSQQQAFIGTQITFDASGSSDPDGVIRSYNWDFGDGSKGSGKILKHSYSTSGNFTVTLEVIDDDNGSDKSSTTIEIRERATGLKSCGFAISNNNAYSSPSAPSTAYVTNELLVKLVNSGSLASQATITSLSTDYQLKSLNEFSSNRPNLFRIPDSKDALDYAKILEKDPRVEYAEPNYYLELLSTPNDSLYDEQWNMWDFGLEEAWDIETGDNEVVVAVIDSSVYTEHEDLASKILPGCDFHNKDNDPNPQAHNTEKSSHGTHVAGIIAAVGNNNKGVTGVGYGKGIKILPIKMFDDAGITGTISELIDGILWAAGISLPGVGKNPNPADIINMSVGTYAAIIGQDGLKSINEATSQAKAKGILLFSASGNDGNSNEIFFPAGDENVIAIGSVDSNMERSYFSNYNVDGPTVDLMAPGGFYKETICGNSKTIRSTFPNNDYGCLAGTSMATPFVSGVAALILSHEPGLSAEQVKAKLLASALYSNDMSHAEYGAGIVCADKALGASTQCGK